MATKIFNPADFDSNNSTNQTQNLDDDNVNIKSYIVTGNSTRDSVRKLLFEIFSADEAD